MSGPGESGDFYASYARFKDYRRPELRPKNMRRYDSEMWQPMAMTPGMSVLEIGCGTGLFLSYLAAKGVTDFIGIDHDPDLAPHLPEAVADRFRAVDVRTFLEGGAEGRTFDRVFLIDVLEHFTTDEGLGLLRAIAGVLGSGGRVLVRVPNAGSPWGGTYQWGDLTHKAAYNPGSIRQLALAAGYVCRSCHPVVQGSWIRRTLDPLVHRIAGRILMSPPEIWTANFIAVLEPDAQ